MTEPMRTGDVQALLGLSEKALRVYRLYGLVSPDLSRGRARWHIEHVDRLRWIMKHKARGCTVKSMAIVLQLSALAASRADSGENATQ